MVIKNWISIVFIFIVLSFLKPFILRADQEDILFIMKASASKHEDKLSLDNEAINSEYSLVTKGVITVYQTFISSQDKATCNFTISCSNFMILAIQKYGLLNGLLIGSDRLQRCNGVGKVNYPYDPDSKLAIDFPLNAYFIFAKNDFSK